MLGAFTSILGALTLALAGIASVSLAVAGVGIMNVMLVSVSERTARDRPPQGPRRRAPADPARLPRRGGAPLLRRAASSASRVGWLAVRALVALYPALPATPPPWAVVAAFSLSVAVGAVFGVLPARRATRLDPVAALSGR